MRFIAILAVLLAFPLFCAWLKQGRRQRLWAYALIGLLPFTINAWQLDAALINWAGWPGYAKGAVITMLDSLALAIVITHPSPKRVTPLLGWLLLYLGAAALSIVSSVTPLASSFYAFQLVRIVILTVAVARIAADPEALRWVAYGLVAGISIQAGMTIWQRAGGALQAAGTMGHQNLLGYMTHFVLLPFLAMLLGGERSKLIKLGVICALIVIVAGASRGAVGFSGLGIGILFVLSLTRRTTPHKWRMLGFAALSLAVASPLAYVSLQERFVTQGTQSGAGEERRAFERAANAIWSDHPMGVGANMYIITANTQGYSRRAGVNWSSGMSTNVHNAYLLVAAETGWLGLFAYIAMLGASIFMGLQFAFANRRDSKGEIALGFTVALIAASAHNLYEWITVMYQAQYMFAISAGVIAGLVRDRRLTGQGKNKSTLPVSALGASEPAFNQLRAQAQDAAAKGSG